MFKPALYLAAYTTMMSRALLILLFLITPSMAVAQNTSITRTEWQMHRGQGTIPDSDNVIDSNADPDLMQYANIPPALDAGWALAPLDGSGNIFFAEASTVPCRDAVDFTYFQTLVDVPIGASVQPFTVTFAQVDDFARVFIFNSAHPNGIYVPGETIIPGNTAVSADLSGFVVAGEVNRVLIVQADTCMIQNNVKDVQIEVSGSVAAEVLDVDGDGILNTADNCVAVANADQANNDGDAAGNLCDAFPGDPTEIADSDGDGVGDNADPFPADPTRNGIAINTLPADSLALVALYNATDGPNWTNKTNWLTGRLSTWHGITVGGDRVTGVALFQNNLVGSLPADLGHLTEAASFNLSDNTISGTIPAELGSLAKATTFALANNQLTGTIPVELGGLTAVENLWLDRNQLSGEIPAALGQLANLKFLALGINQLTGGLPLSLLQVTGLEVLSVPSNQLSGSLPSELGQLTNLTRLDLGANQLTGSLPSELGNLTNLTDLRLHINQLTGTVPPELGQLTQLTQLWLRTNDLEGALPSELGQLANLVTMTIRNNRFSGPLPASFTNLTSLTGMFFTTTALCVPQDAAFQTWIAGVATVSGPGIDCAAAPTGTDQWSATFGNPGLSGGAQTAYSLPGALFMHKGTDGSVYAGGNFTLSGTASVKNIGRWTGTAWEEVGGGLNGPVWMMRTGPDGALYAAGEFTMSGSTTLNHVARFDGTSWASVGDGTNGIVYALDFDANGRLYIGGEFTMAGQTAANNIAYWDGTSWSALGAGVSGQSAAVIALAPASFAGGGFGVFAGGTFLEAGGQAANFIAYWDAGTESWIPHVDGQATGVNAAVTHMVFDPASETLHAGGAFTMAGEQAVGFVASWAQNTWGTMGGGVGGATSSTAINADGSVYVSGTFTQAGATGANNIARWDGTSWTTLGSGVNGWTAGVAVGPGETVYAGGSFSQAGDQTSNFVAAWDLAPPAPVADAVSVNLEEVSGAPGSIIEVPLMVGTLGNASVTAFEADISFNPSHVNILGYNAGPLAANFTVASNQLPNNVFRVGGFSSFPLSGSGELISLRVEILTYGQSTLKFESFRFNDGNPPTTTTDADVIAPIELDIADAQGATGSTLSIPVSFGDLTGAGITQMSVVVEYDPAALSITGVAKVPYAGSASLTALATNRVQVDVSSGSPLTGAGTLFELKVSPLANGQSDMTLTGATFGTLTFPVVLGSGTINVVGLGDVTGDGRVAPFDASQVLRHWAQLITIPANLTPAGDVSGDGLLTPFDASLILQFWAQIIPCFPVETSCSLTKGGSVSADLSWDYEPAINGAEERVSLQMGNVQGDVSSLEMNVMLDDGVTVLGLTSHLPDDWQIIHNEIMVEGQRMLKLGMAGLSPLNAGTLVNLALQRSDSGFDGGPGNLVLATEGAVNGTPVTLFQMHRGEEGVLPGLFALEGNFPNPFRAVTAVRFDLPEAAEVSVEVFDATGRRVFSVPRQSLPAGTGQSVSIDASSLSAGIYLYRVRATMAQGDEFRSGQMMLIK